MHGIKQMTKLYIPTSLLKNSVETLKDSPGKERVVLWLGIEETGKYLVKEVFIPIQETERDHFWIPHEGMKQLLEKLRTSQLMIVAQIHTHPFAAFHSAADDKWAIIGHLNAYSLVLPNFGATTNSSNFKKMVAAFVLSKRNKWQLVSNKNITIV
jgi:hypothetical protein